MKTVKKYLDQLCDVFLKTRNEQELRALLEDLLTPQELLSIAERLEILKELTKGKTQRDIAQHLKTSIGKVTRGSRVLQFGKMKWAKVFS